MSETTTLLGKIITGEHGRDAIHIAVAPSIAAERLYPGQHVGLVAGGVGTSDKPIGIVDPFLRGAVFPEQRFWLFLYPMTITSLRHEWTHPAFATSVAAQPESASMAWLKEYAEEVGLSYAKVMEAAQDWLRDGDYHVFSYDTPNIVYQQREEFWKHYEIVTGTKVEDHEATFFSCSC